MSPLGSPRKSLSTTQVSPAKSGSVSSSPAAIQGSPHSTTSIPVSPLPTRSPPRGNALTVSQARLERLDSLEVRTRVTSVHVMFCPLLDVYEIRGHIGMYSCGLSSFTHPQFEQLVDLTSSTVSGTQNQEASLDFRQNFSH